VEDERVVRRLVVKILESFGDDVAGTSGYTPKSTAHFELEAA
jgi:hypothetical protein